MTAREDWLEHSDTGGPLTWLEWCTALDLRRELAHLDAQALASMRRRAEILKALQGPPEALPVS